MTSRTLWSLIVAGAVIAVAALFGGVTLDVLLRFTTGRGIRATTEMVANWWMIGIVFFGLALAQRERVEIRVDFLVDAVPPPLRRIADVVVAGLVGCVSTAFAYTTLGRALDQMAAGEYAPVGILIWPARFVLPLCFGLVAGVCFVAVYRQLRREYHDDSLGPTGSNVLEGGSELLEPGFESTIPGSFRRISVGILLASPAILALMVALIFSGVSSAAKVGAAIVLLVLLMLVRVPIGIALALVGALGLSSLIGIDAAINTLKESPWSTSASWSLSVIPMFILMGMLLERSGAAASIFGSMRGLLGGVPASLAVCTNAAGAALGAASGSTLGITYALGRMALPEMQRAGYDRRLSAAAVLMAGTGGQLIPPSILLVIYAGIAQVPVGRQLMAGFLPGFALAALYGVTMIVIAVVRPSLAPREPTVKTGSTWLRARALLGVWPIVLLIAIILGGLYQGVFTATEAGAYGVVGSLFIGAVLAGPSALLRSLVPAASGTAIATGSVFLILIGGAVFGRFLTVSGVPRDVAVWLDGAGVGRIGFMLLVLVLYLALGMFMDPVAMMLVSVPVLLPIALLLGIDPLVFGVFVVLLGELSILTPPIGILVFAVHRVARDVGVRLSLGEAFIGVSWFYPVTLLLLLIMILFPGWILWLPESMG